MHTIIPIIGVPFDAFTKVCGDLLCVVLFSLSVLLSLFSLCSGPFGAPHMYQSLSKMSSFLIISSPFYAAKAGLRMIGFLIVIGTVMIGMTVIIHFQ